MKFELKIIDILVKFLIIWTIPTRPVARVVMQECNISTFVNCGHLKKFFTAPWLKNLVEYNYLLPKYSVKILGEKKWAFSFYFTFCKMGILHVSLWRVAL